MTYEEKMMKAKENNIIISDKLLSKDNVVGIYKFFKVKNEKKHCFYIGKSTSMAYRLLGSSNGHIYMYLKGDYSKLVPSKIKEYLSDGYQISVEIEEINYEDTMFSRAAHRLALAELKEIVKYQEMNQCELQTPEGAGMYEERFWEENYKIEQ